MQTDDKSSGARRARQPADAQPSAGTAADRGKVQGEGDYEAARRHRDSATEFARSHDVEAAARDAAPDSPEDERSLLEAERRGRDRSRGEDRRDVMQDVVIDSPQDDKAT